jgi:hypothetical protein
VELACVKRELAEIKIERDRLRKFAVLFANQSQ